MDTSIVSRHQLIAPIARTFIGNKLWVVNKGLMKQMNQGEWCDISFWCSHAFYIEISLGMAKMVLYIVWISSSLDTECILPFLFLNKWTKKSTKQNKKEINGKDPTYCFLCPWAWFWLHYGCSQFVWSLVCIVCMIFVLWWARSNFSSVTWNALHIFFTAAC